MANLFHASSPLTPIHFQKMNCSSPWHSSIFPLNIFFLNRNEVLLLAWRNFWEATYVIPHGEDTPWPTVPNRRDRRGVPGSGDCTCMALILLVFLDATFCVVTLPINKRTLFHTPSTWMAYGPLLQLECSGSNVVPFPSLELKRYCALLFIPLGTLTLVWTSLS